MDFNKCFEKPIQKEYLIPNPILPMERVADGIWTPNPKPTKEKEDKEPKEIRWIRELFERLFGKEQADCFIKRIILRQSFDETFERIFPQINLKKRR